MSVKRKIKLRLQHRILACAILTLSKEKIQANLRNFIISTTLDTLFTEIYQ